MHEFVEPLKETLVVVAASGVGVGGLARIATAKAKTKRKTQPSVPASTKQP